MTNYERITGMTPEELAREIIDNNLLEEAYCKSDCDADFDDDDCCPHPVECCVKWLMEEAD